MDFLLYKLLALLGLSSVLSLVPAAGRTTWGRSRRWSGWLGSSGPRLL